MNLVKHNVSPVYNIIQSYKIEKCGLQNHVTYNYVN